MKISSLSVAIVATVFLSTAIAAVEERDWLYEFHLVWQADGTLLPDPNIQPGYAGGPRIPYNSIPMRYKAVKTSSDNCKGNILRRNGDVLKTFQFECLDRRSGRQIKIRTPEDGSGTAVLFLSPEGKRLGLISVEGSSTCNDNGKCESEFGEDKYRCPFDCPSSKVMHHRVPKK